MQTSYMRTLKNAIGQAGLTQRQIAKEIGISEFRLCKVLTGRLRARPRERRRIAGLLGVPLGKLFRRVRRRVRTI